MGYVALTMHYILATIASALHPSNSLNHRSRRSSNESRLTSRAVAANTVLINSGFLLFKTVTLSLLRAKGRWNNYKERTHREEEVLFLLCPFFIGDPGRLLCRFYLVSDSYSSVTLAVASVNCWQGSQSLRPYNYQRSLRRQAQYIIAIYWAQLYIFRCCLHSENAVTSLAGMTM